ncbi:hypothetical protein HDV03_005343 [Kappamyces sp. JEL0829]|nr:hypothetical protein HDV03_005343 [Kappamyces sp. JEL0829]KAJ3360106.1 hypothetical protein HDU91_004709 [Kappamyces sp. JEL0680]
MSRNPNTAYFLPAGIVLGFGLYSTFQCALLLAGVPNKATAIWRMSTLTCVLLSLICLSDFIFLDYSASPYSAPTWYIAGVSLFGYAINWVATISIAILFVMRIKIFYGFRSTVFRTMMLLAFLLFALKLGGDGILVKVSFESANGTYLNPNDNPWYHWGIFIFAFASIAECLFTAIGSISFLLHLTKFGSEGGWSELRNQVFKKEGVRLTLIVCCHLLLAYFAVLVAFADNYVAHVGFFLPSFAYALELYTFLDLSYNSTKSILSQMQSSLVPKSSGQPGDGVHIFKGSGTAKHFPIISSRTSSK